MPRKTKKYTVLLAHQPSDRALIVFVDSPLSEDQWRRVRRALPVFDISEAAVERLRAEGFSAKIVAYE